MSRLKRLINSWQLLDTPQKLVLLVAFLLPFDRIPSIELKNYTIKLSTIFGGLLILWVSLALVRGKLQRKINKLQKILLAWIVVLLLSFIQVKAWQPALKVQIPLLFLSALAFALSFVAHIVKREHLARAIIAGALIACVFGVFQFVGNYLGLPGWLTGLRDEYTWQKFGFPRMQSVSLEPLYFSAYLLLPISILTTAIVKLKPYRNIRHLSLLALFIFCDALTLSRGGLAALVFMFFVLAVLMYEKEKVKRYWKKIALSLVALAGLLSLGVLSLGLIGRQGQDSDLTYSKKGIAQVISHLSNTRIFASKENKANDDSVNQRQEARNQAIEAIKSSTKILFIGAGPGQYEQYANDNFKPPVYIHPGNVTLEIIVQFGITTLAILVVLLLRIVAIFWKTRRKDFFAVAAVAYILGLALQSNVFSGIAITHVWFMIGISISYVSERRSNERKSTPHKKAARTT